MTDVKKNNNLSISNLDPDWKPPTVGTIDEKWTPPDQPKNDPKSDILDTINKRIFEAPEFVTKGAKSIADTIDPGGTTPKSGFLESIGAIPDIARNIVSEPLATMRGGLAGMTEGAANLLSPANIASYAMPEVGLINKGLGAFQGIHGASKLAHGDISGLGDIGFGVLGMMGGKGRKPTESTPTPKGWAPADLKSKSGMSGSIVDEGGKIIAPAQNFSKSRPAGPWDANVSSDLKKKTAEEIQYELARNKFNMGRDLPGDKKPVIKDYWIIDASGNKKLNPKYQPVNQGNPTAVFKGWQEDGDGGHFALYDIQGGPLDKSTVSDRSLKAAGIPIPETPKFSKVNEGRDAAIKRQKFSTSMNLKGQSVRKANREIEKPSLRNLFEGETGAVRFGSNKEAPIVPISKELPKASLAEKADLELWYKYKKLFDTGKMTDQQMVEWAKIYNKVKNLKVSVTLEPHKFETLPKEEPEFTNYILPDGQKVKLQTSATKGAEKTTFQLKGGKIVEATREDAGPSLKKLFSDQDGVIRFGPNKQKPINASTRNLRKPSDEVVDKLINAISEAGPKRAIQDDLYSVERAKRIRSAENVTEKGLPGFYKQLHELKGELPKVDFERTKIKPSELNDLINYVTNSPVLLPYEKIRAKIGLLKMLSAKREEVPQRGELQLLSEVFGKKFDDVIQMHGGLGGKVSSQVANELANLSKSIMASIDMSAPLRQGLPLIHKKEWWNSIKPMVESFASQDRFDALQDSIKSRPGYLLGKSAGLKLTDMAEHKEEAYASKLADLIPGVKMSERAYIGFLNKLRADTFDSLVNDAVALGHNPAEIAKDIAKFVNTATGRGDLGRLDPIAKELNTLFFSPRLIASRLTMLNPNTYVNKEIPAFVRKESLKSLLAVASFGITMNSLMHAMGASVSLDPINSDFMKSKFGNTRMDPNAGFQQYIVAASRLLTGQTTSSTSGKTSEIGKRYGSPSRVSMMVGVGDKYNRSFMENKFSPLVGLADDILAKRAPDSNGLGGMIAPKSYGADVTNRFVPLMVNDLIDLYKDDPNLFMSGKSLLGTGAALGMGMQTYKQQPKKSNQMKISIR